MSSTRELTTEYIEAILPQWHARYAVLRYEDPSKSDYEFWIEDAMIYIFCHETTIAGNVYLVGRETAFEEFADIADILLD